MASYVFIKKKIQPNLVLVSSHFDVKPSVVRELKTSTSRVKQFKLVFELSAELLLCRNCKMN